MWGQVRCNGFQIINHRIIPTRVGTRHFGITWLYHDKDHPHACGDKERQPEQQQKQLGSSPRVWGQVTNYVRTVLVTGIIPTRVGTRAGSDFEVIENRDHPHACGDKITARKMRYKMIGSSPRVWGQVRYKMILIGAEGIIPTRVGTRLKKSRKIAVLQNQPLRFPLTFHRSFV